MDKENLKNRYPNLLNEAILAPGENGVTPLHSLLTSFCDDNDVAIMRLFVSRLPLKYTAQQLLKLFQKRYPSAYKAKIFKPESREDGQRSDSGKSSTCTYTFVHVHVYMLEVAKQQVYTHVHYCSCSAAWALQL